MGGRGLMDFSLSAGRLGLVVLCCGAAAACGPATPATTAAANAPLDSAKPWAGAWYSTTDYDLGCVDKFADGAFSEYCPDWAGAITRSATYKVDGAVVQIRTADAAIYEFRFSDQDTMDTSSNTEIAQLAGPYSVKRCPTADMVECSRRIVARSKQEEQRVTAEKAQKAQAAAQDAAQQQALASAGAPNP